MKSMLSPVVALALVVSGCGGSSKSQAYAQLAAKDDLAFLPAQAELVVAVDVAGMRASAFFQHFESQFKAKLTAAIQKATAACGVDPVSAIRSAAFGIYAQGSAANVAGGFVVRGLDAVTIGKCLANPEAAAKRDGEAWVIDKPDAKIVIGFATPDIMVGMFTKDSALSAADLRPMLAGASPLAAAQPFAAGWAGLKPGAVRMHAVTSGPLFADMRSNGVATSRLGGSLSLAEDATLTGYATMESPEVATQVVEAAQGQLGMVKGFVKQLDLTNAGADVNLGMAITRDQADSLLKMAGVAGE